MFGIVDQLFVGVVCLFEGNLCVFFVVGDQERYVDFFDYVVQMYVFGDVYEVVDIFGILYLVDVLLVMWYREIVFFFQVFFLYIVLVVIGILYYVIGKVWFYGYYVWVVVVIQ